MIGKLLPRALNTDADERLIKSYEMIDAVNVQISSDNDGDTGVIKNIRGTSAATNTDSYNVGGELTTDATVCVGSVEDHEKGFVYFFVWNTDPSQHAILKYDVTSNAYSIVAKGSLNFPQYGYVDAVLLNDPIYGDNSFIFFTDNVNEPRKINVNRLPSGYNTSLDINNYSEYINACIKTPVFPITHTFTTDLDFRKKNNFYRSEGIYYAYRFAMEDGFYSPISVYSKVSIPTNSVQQGDTGVSQLISNCCVLTIPPYSSYDGEIDKIQIIKRNGNAGNMYIVDEVPAYSDLIRTVDGISRTIWDSSNRKYLFYNDGNYSVVPDQDILKIEEGVPQKAEAITLSGERIIYGNYVDGFDTHDASLASINILYSNIDEADDVSFSASSSYSSGSSTCSVDMSDLPTSIPAGSTISLNISTAPDAIISYNNVGSSLNSAGSLQVNGVDIYYGGDVDHPILAQSYGLSFEMSVYISENQPLASVIDNFSAAINGNTVDGWFDVITNGMVSQEITSGHIISNSGLQYNINHARFVFSAGDSTNTDTSLSFVVKMTDVTDVVFVSGINNYPIVENQSEFFNAAFNSVYTHRYFLSSALPILFSDNNSYLVSYEDFQTFKSGCVHEFGIVYYDGRGRRSNVNYIGSAYVKEQGERTPKGIATARIDLSGLVPPPWARYYQVVYGGNSSIDDFIQFSVPDAYATTTEFSTSEISTDASSKDLIFVPLAFLQNSEVSYSDTTGAIASDGSSVLYKHSAGDMLRIVKYYSDDTTEVYPIDYEFEVVGTVTFTEDENPFNAGPASTSTYTIGEFLVLRNNPNCVNFTRNEIINNSDKWMNRVFVEIYKPKSVNDERDVIFYEVGNVGDVGIFQVGGSIEHSPSVVDINSGDCFFRRKYMNNNYYSGGGWFLPVSQADAGWQMSSNYSNFYLESNNFNDKFKSNTPNRGRAALVIDTSKQTRRKSSVTFSERHILANGRNYLTSFNKHENNRLDLPPRYGAINRLVDRSEFVICLQEHKVSRIPIDRSIISNASGEQQLILSTMPLGTPSFYVGDYGASNDPSAVVKSDAALYFVDKRMGKIVKHTNEGLSIPSDNNMSNFFESRLFPINDETNYYLTAGYDPMNEEVIFTYFGANENFTIAFSDGSNFWKSRYSFYPTKYAHMNGRLISARKTTNLGLIHLHEESSSYNSFYGQSFTGSSMKLVMNYNPSMSKVMQALSIEGTDKWGSNVYAYTNGGVKLESGVFNSFSERENSWWSAIPRSKIDYRVAIGLVESVDGVNVTFTTPINNRPIPAGALYDADDNLLNANQQPVIINRYTLQLVAGITVGTYLYIVPHGQFNGDAIRGQYCHVDLTYNENQPVELYAVNVDFVPSRLDGSLGTQAE